MHANSGGLPLNALVIDCLCLPRHRSGELKRLDSQLQQLEEKQRKKQEQVGRDARKGCAAALLTCAQLRSQLCTAASQHAALAACSHSHHTVASTPRCIHYWHFCLLITPELQLVKLQTEQQRAQQQAGVVPQQQAGLAAA